MHNWAWFFCYYLALWLGAKHALLFSASAACSLASRWKNTPFEMGFRVMDGWLLRRYFIDSDSPLLDLLPPVDGMTDPVVSFDDLTAVMASALANGFVLGPIALS